MASTPKPTYSYRAHSPEQEATLKLLFPDAKITRVYKTGPTATPTGAPIGELPPVKAYRPDLPRNTMPVVKKPPAGGDLLAGPTPEGVRIGNEVNARIMDERRKAAAARAAANAGSSGSSAATPAGIPTGWWQGNKTGWGGGTTPPGWRKSKGGASTTGSGLGGVKGRVRGNRPAGAAPKMPRG